MAVILGASQSVTCNSQTSTQDPGPEYTLCSHTFLNELERDSNVMETQQRRTHLTADTVHCLLKCLLSLTHSQTGISLTIAETPLDSKFLEGSLSSCET